MLDKDDLQGFFNIFYYIALCVFLQEREPLNLNKDNSLINSVKFATGASAIKFSEKETQKAIPTKEEVDHFTERNY